MSPDRASRLVLACPGDPERRTGGTIYDRRLAHGLRARGWSVDWLRLDDGFPFPSTAALSATAAAFVALPDGTLTLVDGLAFGAMPEIAAAEARRLRLVALVHHPLALETGLAAETSVLLAASERRALTHARAVLVTSGTTRAELIRDYALRPAAIGVALPGVDRFPLTLTTDEPPEGLPRLLAVGGVIPRKEMALLVEALAACRHRPWTLDIAGSLERSPEAVAALRAAIDRHDLGGRVRLHGEVGDPALRELYGRASLMVSASAHEGFGMALAEGIAHGLPVVAVAGGAIGEWLDPRASLLVEPGDQGALTASLARVLGDPALLARLRAGAVEARDALPDWGHTALAAEDLLRRVPA